jgi:hypothetical protein
MVMILSRIAPEGNVSTMYSTSNASLLLDKAKPLLLRSGWYVVHRRGQRPPPLRPRRHETFMPDLH